jgi:hypothetical protein
MNFTRVSKTHPCPICKHGDWCRVFTDGWAECMRVQSGQPAKSGGWMHWQGQLPPGPRRCLVPPPRFQPPTINATKLMREWRAATTAAALDGLAASLGLSTPSVTATGAAWATPHGAWAFPMCDGYGNILGIRLRSATGKYAVRGSKQGIFVAEVPPQKTLFVCEGPTDTAAAIELGFFAVGRPNCCCGGPEIRIYARRHQCSRVVVVADNDKPGLDGARKVGGELKLPFAIYVPPAKDLREFVRLGGTRAMIENTLKSTVWNKT